MTFLIYFYIAFLLSTLLVPVGIRLAPRLGIVDKPDARKIHTRTIPRTGGLAIVLGTMAALLVPLSMPRGLAGYICGAAILLCFGLWDDMRQIGYRIKFLGQILAIMAFILISGLKVCCFGELLPGFVFHLGFTSIPMTVVFMLAVINIINLSDGLDGLAGGLSLLVLLACAFLGYTQEATLPIAIALSVSGALIGFMRFNVHPAEVFMGDTGSQFLGYTIGACLIMLTQGHSIYSPVLPLFLLGTPILDTALVIHERIRSGRSPFQPDKNHLHHKLLRAGLNQEQAVISMYGLHFLLIVVGFFLRFAPDYLNLLLYILIILSAFLLRHAAQGKEIRAGETYRAVQHMTRAIFVWNGRNIDVRFGLSWLCWKFFFLVFALFFVINVFFIRVYSQNTIAVCLPVLAIITWMAWRNKMVLPQVLYYLMLGIILYVVAYGEIAKQDSIFLALGPDGVSAIFYVLSALYFGCIILTPEKVPLNALDFLLIAFIGSLALMSDGRSEILGVQHIAMKAVLLGLSLNLIYSRITRNKHYILALVWILFFEACVLALL
jgi:UDP-GlcNAc:undecaprenyl-phosphate GlcNAc-1-phosphate transferase